MLYTSTVSSAWIKVTTSNSSPLQWREHLSQCPKQHAHRIKKESFQIPSESVHSLQIMDALWKAVPGLWCSYTEGPSSKVCGRKRHQPIIDFSQSAKGVVRQHGVQKSARYLGASLWSALNTSRNWTRCSTSSQWRWSRRACWMWLNFRSQQTKPAAMFRTAWCRFNGQRAAPTRRLLQ